MTNVFDDSFSWRQRIKTDSHVGGCSQICSWDEQNFKTKSMRVLLDDVHGIAHNFHITVVSVRLG